ncbi:interferon alpha/beta receptor 2-like isoform X1 [Poecilia latipinna]|uniref:interferon alpha/beta receptor 2-like isoform X1 n=1 Tax=Poecilia latipinna TaxID=48699 RepID=UPI00072DF735|nr:PREDICTED: interferon alpha/beta receptor 2-like isoform X1 [Poecilia latipinna]XP_016517761.1 PREDICTED: interferon alpha/beta receptor 2-like isoform X1 [Poecilia formosa]
MGGTMGLWTLLLLLLHLAVCVSLPAPANVSITSYNMEHILRFWPDPRTPPDARFTVQIHSTRKQRWKTVAECAELTAGQTCNLTSKLKDSFGLYVAQVQAFRTNQTSSWTTSNLFHPLADTVLGPPEVSVSGCGNCLVLQIRDGPVQLKDLQREMELNVRRTRDGAEFRLEQPYQQETVISYLQPGVEYCVSVSFKSLINRNSVPSARRCAFTSPPPPQHSLFLVLGLLGAFTLLVVIVVGRFIFSSKVKNQHLPCMKFRSQSYTCLKSSLSEGDGVTT